MCICRTSGSVCFRRGSRYRQRHRNDSCQRFFYTGGMGEFDSKCSAAVRKEKRAHPEKDIKLFLVEPYMKTEINESKDYYGASFDDVLVPIELAEVHYKKAITQRNKWMIDRSDYLIAFVHRNFGGAYETMKYARRKGSIVIINIAEKER